METDHVIIGGGPAGIFAALTAADLGKRCVILEQNGQIGKKLRITGKGRCNVTNNCSQQDFLLHIPTNRSFLYSALSRCSPQDVMDFFEQQGVALKTERGNRVFPVSDRAEDIVTALQRALRARNIPVIRAKAKHLILKDGICIGVQTTDGTIYSAQSVLLATGGASYPATGSTGDGYRLAKEVGHTIVPPTPSLVPFVTKETWCRDAMGLSLRNITLRLYDGTDCIFSDLGELLFTHFGVSGPLVLRASAHIPQMEPNRYRLELDVKPALSQQQLDLRIQRDLQTYANQDFGNLMRKLLPAKLIPVAAGLAEIPLSEKGNSVKRMQRRKLVQVLKAIPLEIQGFRPLAEAIVTRGGISVKEISAKTMASKLVPGLYFAGELIDVDGYTGGFNLQIAFATGHSAGLAMGSA